MDFSNGQNRLVTLQEVSNEYLESIRRSTKSDPYYPSYHIAPHHGLLNDPNGLSYFNGEHHIFYQWFPLGPVHGLKHWYHLSTKDFLHYQDHGVALYPNDDYDKHGCFTGVGVNYDESLYLFYTANLKENGVRKPTQILATMDKNNQVSKKGIVVDVPTNYTGEFRDPVIIEGEQQYHMLVGAQDLNKQGCIALLSGEKIDQYEHQGTLNIGLSDFGYMWECPNYVELNDKAVLIFSPQGVKSENKYDLKNVYSVIYMLGKPIDFETKTFENHGFVELDKGFDFYAPQIYKDNQNRTILFGWLGNSENAYPTDKNGWAHMLTLPRQLSIAEDRLVQTPLKELEALRQEKISLRELTELHSTAFELLLDVEQEFSLCFENAQGQHMSFSGNAEEFVLNRTHISEPYALDFGTERFAKRLNHEQKIRVFVDNSTLEIFADNGKTTFTSRIFIQDMSKLKISGATGCLYYLAGINYL